MAMRHVNLDLNLDFDTEVGRWRSEQILLYLMTVLTLRNFWFLLDNPDFPKLYDSDMIYLLPEQLERRPTKSKLNALNKFLSETMGMGPGEIQHHLDLAKGVEIFRDAPRMMENGGGDCDNMACLRAAEIAVAAYRLGIKTNVKPYLVWREDGNRMIYHAKVLHVDNNGFESDEDPSIIQGMGGQAKANERREECRKNWERYDNMWQQAKGMLAAETAEGEFKSEDARIARATELKAACDSFGYLPKSGVFRVGQPKQLTNATKARGLDLLGAVKHTRQPDCPPLTHCVDNQLVGRHGGGGRRGGHRGGRGGMRQNWGFGGPAAWSIYPQYDWQPELELEIEYEHGVTHAAPAPGPTRSAR